MKNLFARPEIKIDIFGDPEAKAMLQRFSNLSYPVFINPSVIKGHATFIPPEGTTISHKGIVLSIFGEYRDHENRPVKRFFLKKQSLQPEGRFNTVYETDFTFDSLNFTTATYYGSSINIIFGIDADVIHTFSNTRQESQFILLSFAPRPHPVPIHNVIGMKNVLHIEFVFPNSAYDCNDCVPASAFFILVKLRIVQIYIEIFRFESFCSNVLNFEKKTLIKSYQILDGPPVRGDYIPIRIFLNDSDIWPHSAYAGSELKVQHYLRTHIIDENGKSYYKRLKIKIDRYQPE